MIGSLPSARLAPLEYRYALDAAMALLAGAAPLTVCHVAALWPELQQRVPNAPSSHANAAVWVEPQAHSWNGELDGLMRGLSSNATLLVVASQPLARLLPERRGWDDDPLGMRVGGMRALLRGLARAGFGVRERHGLHGIESIALNALAAQAARRGRTALADRLGFAARLRYRSAGRTAGLGTVALLVARREGAGARA